MFKYAILGPVELSDGERPLPVGGPRQLALLALLLINANRPLPRDRIIAALWGDLGSGAAGKRLQVAIGRLRRTLDPHGAKVLRTVPGGYLLTVRDGELDAEVFRARVAEGRRALEDGDAERARDVLRGAVTMWRGPALAEVSYLKFARTEIRRLEELRMTAVEARVDCELQLGAHNGVIAELQALAAAYPARERLAAQLMLALSRSGREREALDVYARTRAYLVAELGLEPGPALQALQAEVLARSRTPTPASRASGAARLPTGVVTFLLTDIEGSTRLWEADSDAMAAALALHDALVARVVERHGGRQLKDKSEGDSTCSVFRRASDAVACAAEVQRAVARATDEGGVELRLRIALHSGEAQERGGDYLGPTLNRASRLRSLAAGGVTVVSQATAELVRDGLAQELTLVDIGRHELRGLSRPEHVFELRACADPAAGGEAAPVALPLPRSLYAAMGSPFVGRVAELERLRECWTALCSGRGGAVVVGGEAGIGKTRLASELARAVHEQGAVVLYGRCDEGLAVPYQPFVQALRPYVAAAGLDRLRGELGHLAPELGRLLPELTGLGLPMRADPESERFALFEAVAALVEAATRRQPMLLVLDDLHWATSPTLLLLRHLIRSERPLRALLLCTHRATELHLGDPLAQLLADLQGDHNVQRLSLTGLDERAIAELLEAAVGQPLDERATALVHALEAQTAGNPFFIRELLANVVESGRMPDCERLDAHATAAQLEVPAGLRHVIGQRVARLSAPTGRALNVAAVAGPRFSFAVLERVLGEDAGVLDALDEATAAGLLTEAGQGRYAFAHALVRQTLYERLGSLRRARLHGQVGEALEALPGSEAYVETLAHHFAQAATDGQGVKAADYALAAGRIATGRLGYEEAAAHYEQGLQALALTAQPEDERRCQLLIALGQARWDAGDLEGARQASAEAAGLAQKLHDRIALARAALSYCGPNRFELAVAVTQPVVDLLQRALLALGDEPSPLRAQLLGRLATFSDATRKPVIARQALDMARQVADPATLSGVIAATIWATNGPDTLHESLAMTRELGRLADDLGDSRLRALAHEWLLDHLLELGDIEAAEREFQALQRLAETRRERYFKWHVTAIRANHAHLRGAIERCEALANAALAHRFEGHDEPATNTFWAQLFFVRREQGRLDELVEAVVGFAAQSPHLPVWRCGLASIYAQLGRRAQARRELEGLAGAGFADLPRDTLWFASLSWLTDAAVFLGDAKRARLLYELMSPYADRCVVLQNLLGEGSVARQLGLLATTLSRYDDAARHFEHALEVNAHIRSPLWIGHTQHDYARMLLLRDGPGDRDTAIELVTDALATAEQLGLRALADKARRLKPTAGAAVPW